MATAQNLVRKIPTHDSSDILAFVVISIRLGAICYAGVVSCRFVYRQTQLAFLYVDVCVICVVWAA